MVGKDVIELFGLSSGDTIAYDRDSGELSSGDRIVAQLPDRLTFESESFSFINVDRSDVDRSKLTLNIPGISGGGDSGGNNGGNNGNNKNIVGTGRPDTLDGGDGNDTINGGGANDLFRGGNGKDVLLGGAANDTLDGGRGNDTLDGGNGKDSLIGGNGKDILLGEVNQDTLDGGNGNDLLDGGGANDILFGGNGVDTLIGGAANDTLYGGGNNDNLEGGRGKDIFVLAPGEGVELISDFELNRDSIGLSDGLSFGDLGFDGDRITLASSDEILATLNGIDTSSLTEADFV